jgi:hypothetical protein
MWSQLGRPYAAGVTASSWRSEVRILLVHPDDAAILVHSRGGVFTLPRVRLPERVWLAEPLALIAAVRMQLGLEVTELFPLAEVVDEQAATADAAVACEVRAGLARRNCRRRKNLFDREIVS